ncbi:MAG TPA: ImmA/IrrE family metallo-endopeptidase [Ignavibacteriaceae bacterium]|nr:ImmA/IrrE family metallo-endopeptidase [Ignavibacteriaceae bacterium]
MPTPTERAQEILNDFGFKKPSEIVVEEIANAKAAIIEEADLNGPLGQIFLTSDFALIKIERSIREPGQRRFTEAHELGHYVIESTNGKYLSFLCNAEDINSFLSNKKRESDANEFASELLMPREWVKSFTDKKELRIELIKESADYFGVSLTAMAFRYTALGKTPTALVVSENGKVKGQAAVISSPLNLLNRGVPLKRNHLFFRYLIRMNLILIKHLSRQVRGLVMISTVENRLIFMNKMFI